MDNVVAMPLSHEQAVAIVALERTGASLSLVGVVMIAVTFAFFKRLRTVPNTFILFASIANIGASTASLIGLAGIALGSGSGLCRAQAFLLEMFMQSDPWWSFAMAFNVYLVFFHAANPTTFRRHLWVYCLVCFGFPFIPAVVCLFVSSSERGPVYGDATLWCWISDEWNAVRIYSYYIPIWVCIFLSAAIYVAVGYHVFHQRNQLRNLTLSNQAKDLSSSDRGEQTQASQTSPTVHMTSINPLSNYGMVTTEVQVTSDACDPSTNERSQPSTPLGSPVPDMSPWGEHTISPPEPVQKKTKRNKHTRNASDVNGSTHRLQPVQGPITSHTNYIHPHAVHYYHRGGGGTTTISIGRPRPSAMGENLTSVGRCRLAWGRFTGRLRHMDPVKLAYLRTSFVFAISVLVTWTPSSINRVYTIVYPDRASYGLTIASAAVLPLQGVWNAVIYFSTSWGLLKEEYLRSGRRWPFATASTHSRGIRSIPGIIVDQDTEMQVQTGVHEQEVRGRPSGGSTRAFAGLHGSHGNAMCYVSSNEDNGNHADDSTSDSLDGLSNDTPTRFRPAPAVVNVAGLGMDTPPVGTLRVQRGGELDV